jgi:hypothetical protein
VETFLVRVWTPAEDPGDEEAIRNLRGFVERVGSGTPLLFRDGEELLHLVRAALRVDSRPLLPPWPSTAHSPCGMNPM